MGDDKRPKLMPFPVNKSVEQSHRKHGDESANPHGGVQIPAKSGADQYGNPHAMSLQRVENVTTLDGFLEHRIDDRDENDERDGQVANPVKIEGPVKNPC